MVLSRYELIIYWYYPHTVVLGTNTGEISNK
jgi:hypothetical protein